jgi:hypothetical protein
LFILRFIPIGVFDDATVRSIGRAFDAACKELKDTGQPDVVYEVMIKRIIAVIDAGIISCMDRWVKQRVNVDTAGELLRGVQRIRRLIAATINDRFVHLRFERRRLVPASAADQRKIELGAQFDGYVKGDRILGTPEAWQRWWTGFGADAIKQHLLCERLLIAGRNGEVPSPEKFRSGWPAARFYVLARAFIEL